jgi:hypothetical protein
MQRDEQLGSLKFNALHSFITTNHFSVTESDCLIVFEIYGKTVLQLGMCWRYVWRMLIRWMPSSCLLRLTALISP